MVTLHVWFFSLDLIIGSFCCNYPMWSWLKKRQISAHNNNDRWIQIPNSNPGISPSYSPTSKWLVVRRCSQSTIYMYRYIHYTNIYCHYPDESDTKHGNMPATTEQVPLKGVAVARRCSQGSAFARTEGWRHPRNSALLHRRSTPI